MRTLKFLHMGFDVIVSISNDAFSFFRDRDNPEADANYYHGYFLNLLDPQVLEYIDLFSKKTGLRGIRILHAHGGFKENQWIYTDGNKESDVQTWVSRKDGTCACIFILSCNPGHATLATKKSILILPDRDTALIDDQVCFSLIGPGGREISGYIIDSAIKDLQVEVGLQV